MIYYEAVVGSRCFGLELPNSDVDIARIADDWSERKHEGRKHYLQRPREVVLSWLTYETMFPHSFQWLFPAEVISSGAVTDFLVAHREEFISANLPAVWEVFWTMGNGLRANASQYYQQFPKRLTYSTLRFDTLARFAQGVPFAQAFKPGEEMRQKLLAMRRCELPLEAALAINSEVRNRAEKSAGFYRKSVDNQYLSNAKRELERLLF